MFKHLARHPYLIACVAFILLCLSSLNNLPYGDDNIFVFTGYIKDVENVFAFWNPYDHYFKSWPLPHTVFAIMLKVFDYNPIPFRLLNLVVHIANTFLFLRFLKLWKPESSGRERYLLYIAFLFHPIAFVTFNWVFQLKTLACVFFSLLSLIWLKKAERKPLKFSLPALLAFFLALTSKIACVVLPVFLLFQYKGHKNKILFTLLTLCFFSLSTFYGLINLKGINSFFKERAISEKSVTEYAQDPEKVKGPEEFVPSNYYFVDLKTQLADSAQSLKKQFDDARDIKLKTLISLFTFGRYINSSFGLNKYAIVYEPNWASLSPGVILPFIVSTFIFLLVFVSKERWKELLLVLIFFIPVSGMFYVPYMKFSYISDHWFYPALPFFLTFLVIGRDRKFQTLVCGIIIIQFVFLSFEFSSTKKITEASYSRYQNPFLYGYMIEEAELKGDAQKAYEMVQHSAKEHGRKTELSVKTKLKLNIEVLHNDKFGDDLRDFLDYSIAKGDFQVALEFLNKYRQHLDPKEANLYHVLITGSAKVAGQGEVELADRMFRGL